MTIYSAHEILKSASMDHVLTRAVGLAFFTCPDTCLYEVVAVRPNAVFLRRRSTGTVFEITS